MKEKLKILLINCPGRIKILNNEWVWIKPLAISRFFSFQSNFFLKIYEYHFCLNVFFLNWWLEECTNWTSDTFLYSTIPWHQLNCRIAKHVSHAFPVHKIFLQFCSITYNPKKPNFSQIRDKTPFQKCSPFPNWVFQKGSTASSLTNYNAAGS